MWLITTDGFYSVVQDLHDRNRLLIRARVRKDLERLPIVGKWKILHTPMADYPYRMVVQKTAWERVLSTLARRVRYPNFKDAVKKRRGMKRALTYAKVWGILQELEQRRGPWAATYIS